MPELPDLEVICEFLTPRIVGLSITSALVLRPIVVRNLVGGDLVERLVGQRFADIGRRGKFLILSLEDGDHLLINPMLAGRIRYGAPLARHRKRDTLVLGLSDGHEMRYYDGKDMGKVYVAHDLSQVPTFAEHGPEATDRDLTLARFRDLLRRQQGEIKEILVRQSFVSGIGNAYADEICWRAEIYPFLRRPTLSEDEVERLYTAMRDVLAEAIQTLRERVNDEIDVEIRDFLSVHGKPGEACPRCGSPISEVKRARQATHFCRTCQPGLMITRKRKP